ncbi:MAG: hypothetical protein BRD50_08710 [Bacteroidetes bacterium SW_11_45_7]|nr:MAG: hypothetical protein BRD50_08710 [Bacteroidetes bacterium SW_11_45_7]
MTILAAYQGTYNYLYVHNPKIQMTMAYSFQQDERIESGFKRIAADQIDRAISSLQEQEKLREGIHDLRKRMKKLRGLLRLARSGIGDDVYQQENDCFRNIARDFSSVRDLTVLHEKLQVINQEITNDACKSEIEGAIQQLAEQEEQEIASLQEDGSRITNSISALQESRERLMNLSLATDFQDVISNGLKRNYKRGGNAFLVAYETGDDEDIHEWRKRTKYLWYHLRLLKSAWLAVLEPLAEEAHRLSTYLGNDHDYTVLADAMGNRQMSDKTKDLLAGQINEKREELHQNAYPLGQKIYAEKPKQFSRRMEAYWEAWQNNQLVENSSLLAAS